MSAHVLLNLLNRFGGKRSNAVAYTAFYWLFATSLMNSIKREYEC